MDFGRMFQRDERHREKRASGAGLQEKRPAGGAGLQEKRPAGGAGGGAPSSAGGAPHPPHPLTCLGGIQRLAWQSLELAGPVTDIVRMQQANWFQLSGQSRARGRGSCEGWGRRGPGQGRVTGLPRTRALGIVRVTGVAPC